MLTKAQIEARKLALLNAASRVIDTHAAIRSNSASDTKNAVAAAVKVSKAILQEIDDAEEKTATRT